MITAAPTTITPEELVNVDELARITKIKKNTIYKLALDRKIPSFKIGKIRRFRVSEVMNVLETCRVDARPKR